MTKETAQKHSAVRLVVIALFVIGYAYGQSCSAPPVDRQVLQLATGFEKETGTRVGLCVIDLKSGRTICSNHAEDPFIPASNQKLLTTAFALGRLGADFHFTTALCRRGNDLILTGEGDPLLGDPVVARRLGKSIYDEPDRWAIAARRQMGDEIKGDLLIRRQISPANYHHPDWPDRHSRRWFGAPVADLNYHDNCFDVTFVQDGQTVQPRVAPAGRYIRVVNAVKLDPKGRHIWHLASSPDDSEVTISGTICGPGLDPISVPVSDPPMLLGWVLADRLERAGIRLKGKVRVVAAAALDISGARILARTETPLWAVLDRANQRSLNLAAECAFLRAGNGAWLGSAALMQDFLQRRYGLNAKTLVVRDGSGLSDQNRIAPADLAGLLRQMAQGPLIRRIVETLPRSGESGSLRRRLKESAYRGRIAAKTGSIAGVRCLSGYILDKSGRPTTAFAILINDIRGPAEKAMRLQDAICRMLVDSPM